MKKSKRKFLRIKRLWLEDTTETEEEYDVEEDVNTLGGEELSEEFREK